MPTAHQIARVVKRCLERGRTVDIDGLGVFRPGAKGEFEFVAHARPKVFIAYVQEDAWAAEKLYDGFREAGFDPWLDRRKLLPGQNWPRSIEAAIHVADFFVACFSKRAALKRGQFQAELRYALDCARRMPLDETFLIPVRIEDCRVPLRISDKVQYVDLFPDWNVGFERVLGAMRAQTAARDSLRMAG